MRVERVYDWASGEGFSERDPQNLDPQIREENTTRLGHLSDTHLGKGEPLERRREMRRWLETLVGLGVDAVVHSGDLVESPDDPELVDDAFSLFDKLSVPVYGVPGNHDVHQPGENSAITRRWGPFPRSEVVGEVRLWLVDSMAWPAAEQRSEKERNLAEESGFFTSGGVGPRQLQTLKESLQAPWDGPQVLVVHHHPRQPVPAKPWYEKNADLMAPLADADELLQLAGDADIELILHGHRHQYVAPYAPFANLAIINGGSSTRESWPKRARIVDVANGCRALRIWELLRHS